MGAFGGQAYHSNEDMKINSGDSGFPVHGTVHGVTLNNSRTFGGKLTAWYLPRKYNWQPQVGFELDFTRFTADLDPQLRGMDGTVAVPGFQLGAFQFAFDRDLNVNTLAANLLFRYPVWSTQIFRRDGSLHTLVLASAHSELSCPSRSSRIEKWITPLLGSCSWAEVLRDEKSRCLRRVQADLVLPRLYILRFRYKAPWI